METPQVISHGRRASAGSQKLLLADCNLGGKKSPHNCLVEVDQKQNHTQSPCKHIIGTRTRLKGVYNGLITSKELLKGMARVCPFEEQSCTGLSLFSALKFELDRGCVRVSRMIQEERTKGSEIDLLFKKLEEEKLLWKLKEHDRIRRAITSIAGELETERKIRRQTERLNKKLGRELAETKASLSEAKKELEGERQAREILEQVCDELARDVGEDRAEVEEMKRRWEKVCEEVEREREMLQLANVLREERVQMKLAEAKYQFEEKFALVDKLRNELEAYLKPKKGEERVGGSPSYGRIKELEKCFRETLPVSKNKDGDNEEDEEDGDDSAESDLHSIELNMDDINKCFRWSGAVRNGSKRNSLDKSKGGKSNSDNIKKPVISSETKCADALDYECTANKQETSDVFDSRGLFEFSSQHPKKDIEDEIERYNMIKDLRDHIVSSSRVASSQELASPSGTFAQTSVPPNELTCHG